MKKKIKVLYVEDNPLDADLLVSYFKEEADEFSITVVETGTACKKILGTDKFDLILLDNKLPDMNGIDILRELVITMKDVPKVLMTGTGCEELVIQALRIGAADYVVKNGDYVEKLPFVFKTAITEYKKVPDSLNRFVVAQKRILYIEKNKMDVDLTINQLKTEAPNLQIDSARTAQEGLRILKGDNSIDLILMDLSIDDMDALTFLKEMKFIGIKKPLIIVTAHGDENKAVIAVKLGAYDYIVKRDKYLKQLPYSIFNALDKFNSDQDNDCLKDELIKVNKSLEAKVEERTSSLLEEIAERKLAEKQILKLNRVYSLLSNINQAIVRIHDSGKLFDEVCRIAIDEGKFRMAWVGLVNSATGKVEVQASAGIIGDFLDKIDIDVKQRKQTQRPVERAIQTGKVYLVKDMSKDKNMIPWREHALDLGYQSCIAFPIICKGLVRGTYTLYSDEVDFFDLEEIKLLDEMASDISFAIEFIEGEAERKKSEAALLESELRFEQITENAKEWIWEVDKNGLYTYVSTVVKELLGYEPNELIGKKYFYDLFDEKDKVELKRLALEIFERKECFKDLLNINKHKDGRKIIMSTTATPMLDGKGNLTGYRGVDIDITERVQTLMELHESEERYRSLYENTTLGLYRTTPDGRILLANPALIKILGYSSFEEISARNLEEEGFNPNYERKYFIEQIEKKGEVFGLESTWVRKDGAVVYISESARLIRDETGRTLYYDGTVEDITKRKQAEMLLRETQEKIQKIYNSSPNGISMINLDGEIVECNRATVGMVGYSSKEELLGKNGFNFVVRKDRKRAFEMMRKLYTIEETIHSIELEMQRLDGSRFTAEHAASLLQDSTGNLIGVVVITTDITERKRAEEALRTREAYLSAIIENQPGLLWLKDTESRFLAVNQVFVVSCGMKTANDVVGKTDFDVWSHELAVKYRADDARVMQMAESTSVEELIEAEHELKWFETFKTPVKNVNGKIMGTTGYARDITERKKILEDLILAKEKAVESDKLKSEFLAQMSHEIRTPLNAIVGNVELLHETFNENMDEDTRVSFDGINLASKRIIRTIDLILNVAEFQTSGYKPYPVKVDLNTEILSKLHHEHLLSAKQKGLEFIYTCKEKNSGIVADSYSLMQIFANLIDNAIKYTIKGKVELLLERNSLGNIIVEVKDTGIGISKSFLPKLFERFVQETQGANRHYDGNGLGLSLVKNYCEINNASIEVESKKNVGSTFRVIFQN